MYSNILSLLCTLCILLISCASCVVIRDPGSAPDMAVRTADASPNTPVARTLWGAAVRQELSPNRARTVNKKAREPATTPIGGTLWESSVHEKVKSERSDIRAERYENTPVPGLIFENSVHEEIYYS